MMTGLVAADVFLNFYKPFTLFPSIFPVSLFFQIPSSCSNDLPFVSGIIFHTKIAERTLIKP